MLRAFVTGRAGVNVLARQHGLAVRVLDIAVDAESTDLPAEVTAYKLRRSSGPIHLADALSHRRGRGGAARSGTTVAEQEIAAGADLLVLGDMGIGNTTPAAALIAATFGVGADQVTGRGTGIDDAATGRQDRVDRHRPAPSRRTRTGSSAAAGRARFGRYRGRASDSWWRRRGPGCPSCWTGSSAWPRRVSRRISLPVCWAGAPPGIARPSRRSGWRWTSWDWSRCSISACVSARAAAQWLRVPLLRSAVLLVREMARLSELVPGP